MSLVIPPGFGLAAFVLTGPVGTQPYVTTCGVDLSAVAGDFEAAANSAMTAYAEAMGPETSSALTLDRVTLSVGQDGPGGSVDSTLAPIPMTSAGTFPPTALSLIARKTTNVLGRSGRGRMFIPGTLTETDVDQNGEITTTALGTQGTMLANFYAALRDGSSDPTFNLPLQPYLLHSVGSLLAPTLISGFAPSITVGWIRGRIR